MLAFSLAIAALAVLAGAVAGLSRSMGFGVVCSGFRGSGWAVLWHIQAVDLNSELLAPVGSVSFTHSADVWL